MIAGRNRCRYTCMGHLSARELDLCTKVIALCACNQLRKASRELTRHYDAALAQSGLAAT
ncbi:MAG: hypothetical protein QOH83_717, partial [Solirubrobacteraceae bacterium]|nr:hypothetical protein [Solirubrobacteraceae bacterium]